MKRYSIPALIAVIVICAIGWSVYWVIGGRIMDERVERWLDFPADSGWSVAYDSVALAGYPNRFDSTVTGFELRHKDSEAAWRINPLRLFALSYQPQKFIAVWPAEQTVVLPRGGLVDVFTDDMRASMSFADSALPYEAVMSIKGALLATPKGAVPIEDALFAMRAVDGEGAGSGADYDVDMRVDGLYLPVQDEPSRIDGHIRARVVMDAESVGVGRVGRVDIMSSDVRLEGVVLQATGSLGADTDGYLVGDLSVAVQNYTELPALLAVYGVIKPTMAAAVGKTLSFISALALDKSRVSVPLRFDGGKMYLGPLPIGEAPRITIN